MTRKEAIEFIENSQATCFRYGDLGYVTEKQEAIKDINNMDEDSWNDGDIIEATGFQTELHAPTIWIRGEIFDTIEEAFASATAEFEALHKLDKKDREIWIYDLSQGEDFCVEIIK